MVDTRQQEFQISRKVFAAAADDVDMGSLKRRKCWIAC